MALPHICMCMGATGLPAGDVAPPFELSASATSREGCGGVRGASPLPEIGIQRRLMSALFARGIEKSYADRQILRGCDLSLAAGDRVGLVGANGCGKSTLVAILAGELESDGGEGLRFAQSR